MAKVRLEKKTDHTCSEAFSTLRLMLENDETLRKLDSRYRCEFNEKNLTGNVKGNGFDAQVGVQSLSEGAIIKIDVDLSFLLNPFKEKIRQTLQSKLDEKFHS